MISHYAKSDLDMLNIDFLNKFFGNITVWGNRYNITISLSCKKYNEYIPIKKAIEYKFGLPMPIPQKDGDYKYILQPIPYTTHRLLQMIVPKWTKTKIKSTHIEDVLKKTQKGKIRIYAAGGIEKAPDSGIQYRADLANIMQMTPTQIINPCDFTYNSKYKSTSEYRRNHNLQDTYKFANEIVRGDLEYIQHSDMIAVYLDKFLGYGTTSEATVASHLGKPVYGIIAPGFDLNDLNTWILGCIDRFFDSINQFRGFMLQCENTK